MNYRNEEHSIEWLVKLIDGGKINLRPSYQRNFIWTPKDQRLLIDSIHHGFPLPNFFILENGDMTYEMVDGQQRAITIHKYFRNEFKDSNRQSFDDTDKDGFLNYRLNIVILKDMQEGMKEYFFSLVNKRGVHLNTAELNQAQYHDSDFLQLVNKIMNLQDLIELDIFTDKNKLRMNDRGAIEEIVAYLFDDKIFDKRTEVDMLFEQQLPQEKLEEVYAKFVNILKRLSVLNQIRPLHETRYKQKNDFYTLCCFINRHISDDLDILRYQYEILVMFSDEEFITPSNENCEPFKEYALNCVSQSNSKKAREARLAFFEDVLCNQDEQLNNTLVQVKDYLSFEFDNCSLIKQGKYLLINLTSLH